MASCPTTDHGGRTVRGQVRDQDGGSTAYLAAVTIVNRPPQMQAPGNQTGVEGVSRTFGLGGFNDVAGDGPFTVGINWGDGSSSTFSVPAPGPLSAPHVYADNGTDTVVVSVTDKDGASGTASFVATVNNVAPTVNAGADATIDEGGTFASGDSFMDPGADTWTASVNYGDGSGDQPLALSGKAFTLNHVSADNGTYTVTVKVNDGPATSAGAAVVTVANVAPSVTASVSPAAIVESGATTVSGGFTDPGTIDSHTVVINWGDGTSSAAPVAAGAAKTFSATHQYPDDSPSGTAAGVYPITITVMDKDGASGGVVGTVNDSC